MEKKYIFISSIIACIFLYLIEQVIMADYLVKTITKIIFFTVIPVIYIKLIKKDSILNALNLRSVNRHNLKIGLLFGSASFAILLLGFYLFKDFIDLQGIVAEMEEKSNINPTNFMMVGAYITLGNSFLEEFFFRGFIFLNLYNLKLKKSAYIYSALLFAIYHIGIFQTWFNPWLNISAVTGLIIIGFVFNWLCTKSNNFLNSWVVHILADAAIILIGMRLLGML